MTITIMTAHTAVYDATNMWCLLMMLSVWMNDKDDMYSISLLSDIQSDYTTVGNTPACTYQLHTDAWSDVGSSKEACQLSKLIKA